MGPLPVGLSQWDPRGGDRGVGANAVGVPNAVPANTVGVSNAG